MYSVRVYGESFARLKANQYTYLFITCDVFSLALQGPETSMPVAP